MLLAVCRRRRIPGLFALLSLLAIGCGAEPGTRGEEGPGASAEDGPGEGEGSSAAVLAPSARASAAMAQEPGRPDALLFGGQSGASYLSDTWAWDGVSWQLRNPVGQIPLARAGHAMAPLSDGGSGHVVMFGGKDAAGYFGDTWTWSLVDSAWMWTFATPTTAPPPRAGTSMVSLGAGEVLLFGGTNGISYFSDAWAWDGSIWSELTSGSEPPARAYAAMSVDVSGKVVLFGGRTLLTDGALGHLGDTWVLSGSTWTDATPAAGSPSPPAREGAVMVFDADRGVHVLFGGKGATRTLNDTWAFDGSAWRELDARPAPRAHAAAAYHDGSKKVVLFGGASGTGAAQRSTWTFGGSEWFDASMPLTPGISAGLWHTCARKTDGTLSCWGRLKEGQLGDGSNWSYNNRPQLTEYEPGASRDTPGEVLDVPDGTEIAAGSRHGCARRLDGSVACWGSNSAGQLGDGTTSKRTIPVAVKSLAGAAGITAGGAHTCARTAGGLAYCWGDNASGELGDGTLTMRTTPVAVDGLSGVVAIAAGGNHTCALKEGGSLYCWGNNASGQIGNGTTTSRATPALVLSGVVSVAAGENHTCAVKADDSLWCWGANGSGQLGDGTKTGRLSPVKVKNLSRVAEVTAGAEHTCARKFGGVVYCWGNNASGQLGDGTKTSRTTPAPIKHPLADAEASVESKTSSLMTGPELSHVAEVAAGYYHTCAREADGTVLCWGSNDYGQLGDGLAVMYNSRPMPAPALVVLY